MSRYKYLLFSVLFIMLYVPTFAEEYTFRMDSIMHNLKQASYGRLRVIDMRNNKENIGELKTGALNRSRPIVTGKPFSEFLADYYGRMVTGARNENTELVLVLYNFEIVDRVNGGEIGTFYFDGDFYGHQNNKLAYLGKVDSIYEVASSWDVTKVLLRSTKQKLTSLLVRYATQPLPDDYTLSETDALARRQSEKNMHPIYQTREFKKGIYYTADQFLRNEPVDTPFIRSVIFPSGGKKQIFFYYPNEKGKKGKRIKEDTYFAIYDGKDWAVPGHFYAETMRHENGDFYANLPFRGVFDKSSVVGAGMMFGMAGAAIAAASSGDDGMAWGIYKAKFDPETKSFVPQKRLN